jgi:hypothetical protein
MFERSPIDLVKSAQASFFEQQVKIILLDCSICRPTQGCLCANLHLLGSSEKYLLRIIPDIQRLFRP